MNTSKLTFISLSHEITSPTLETTKTTREEENVIELKTTSKFL